MKRLIPATLLTFCTAATLAQSTPPAATPSASTAQPLALLLEQAIYQEQTAGNPEAAEAFHGAIRKDPTSSAALAGGGWAALNSGEQHNGAQNYFWRALALDPKNASALNGLGWSWMKNPEFVPPGGSPREEARK